MEVLVTPPAQAGHAQARNAQLLSHRGDLCDLIFDLQGPRSNGELQIHAFRFELPAYAFQVFCVGRCELRNIHLASVRPEALAEVYIFFRRYRGSLTARRFASLATADRK